MRRLVIAGLLAAAMASCAPGPRDYAEAEVLRAQAEATRVAVEYQQRINEQDIQLRATAAAAELGARLAEIDARRESEVARGQAQVRLLTAGSYGLVAVLSMLATVKPEESGASITFSTDGNAAVSRCLA